uniref:Uncharacterized protein n=1 Tax=Arundo donax TaxID=35708 RepID=A0A0A9HG00_ARUDO
MLEDRSENYMGDGELMECVL